MCEYILKEWGPPERCEQLSLGEGTKQRKLAVFDDAAKRTAPERRAELAEGQHGLVGAAYLTVYPDSRLVELHIPQFGGSEPPTSKRGDVDGLSDESRRRLMRLLHSFKRSASNPAFVTLTFPDEAIPTAREAKECMQTLFKRWARMSPKLCGVWRIESHPQRSRSLGKPVPHFHLLVWGAWIDRGELSADWAQIVHERWNTSERAHVKHLLAGTKIEAIRSFRGVCSYASKYISKRSDESLGEKAGRVWGIFNRDCLPIGRAETHKLDARGVVRVARFVRQFLFKRGIETEWMPRAIYLEHPGRLLELLR